MSLVSSAQLSTQEEGVIKEKKSPRKDFCFKYQLENECSTIVNEVILDKALQEASFDLIRLNISALRMLPPLCRRPSLWYLCTSAFPHCPP